MTIIKHAWFVHVEHDLYGGIAYHGPYDSEEDAKRNENNLAASRHYLADHVSYIYAPFVTHDGKVHALFEDTAANPSTIEKT